MSKDQIEMSSVALLQILAGELSMQEFCREYDLEYNPFKNALMSFRTIKSIRTEPAENRDDDKVIIKFRTHDAAIGPFRVPDDLKGPIR